MSIGSNHHETGRIGYDRGALVLWREEGGRWRLDGDDRLKALIGERVTIEGRRTDFDLLEVAQYRPAPREAAIIQHAVRKSP